MTITKFDPLALVGGTLFNDLNRLFAKPLHGPGIAIESWTPRVDIAETDDRFIIRAELAGVDPDSVDVTVEQGVLSITGNRSFDSAGEEGEDGQVRYLRREIVTGSFARKIRLGEDVDVDAVTASAGDGVIEVTVPKQAAALPRKVTVDVQR